MLGSRRIPRPGTATLLFTCLFAVQASFLTVAPILPELARDFGVSTATGGQLRTVSGLAGVVAAMGARTLAASAFGLQSAGAERVAIGALRAAVTQVGYLAGAAIGGVALAAGGRAALSSVLAVVGVLAVVPHLVLVLSASRRRSAPVPA